MKPTDENREPVIDHISTRSLELAMGIEGANYDATFGEQGDQKPAPSLSPFLFDFVGRESIEFAFTESQTAKFHVPAHRRFVIEQLNVACWAKNQHWDVHLVTQSSCTYCNLIPTRWLEPEPSGEQVDLATPRPTAVHGSTTYTLQFGNAKEQSSPTVPPDTYVRVCGHLEAANDMTIFAMTTEDARICSRD